MSEPRLILMAGPTIFVIIGLSEWFVKHPKCRCGKRMKIVSEGNNKVVSVCPNGCAAPTL